jgi:hypothetical protein
MSLCGPPDSAARSCELVATSISICLGRQCDGISGSADRKGFGRDPNVVQAFDVAELSYHSRAHEIPKLSNAIVHTDPSSLGGVDPHATGAITVRPAIRTPSRTIRATFPDTALHGTDRDGGLRRRDLRSACAHNCRGGCWGNHPMDRRLSQLHDPDPARVRLGCHHLHRMIRGVRSEQPPIAMITCSGNSCQTRSHCVPYRLGRKMRSPFSFRPTARPDRSRPCGLAASTCTFKIGVLSLPAFHRQRSPIVLKEGGTSDLQSDGASTSSGYNSVWIGQGTNVLSNSKLMSGHGQYTLLGLVVFLVGLALLRWAVRIWRCAVEQDGDG